MLCLIFLPTSLSLSLQFWPVRRGDVNKQKQVVRASTSRLGWLVSENLEEMRCDLVLCRQKASCEARIRKMRRWRTVVIGLLSKTNEWLAVSPLLSCSSRIDSWTRIHLYHQFTLYFLLQVLDSFPRGSQLLHATFARPSEQN